MQKKYMIPTRYDIFYREVVLQLPAIHRPRGNIFVGESLNPTPIGRVLESTFVSRLRTYPGRGSKYLGGSRFMGNVVATSCFGFSLFPSIWQQRLSAERARGVIGVAMPVLATNRNNASRRLVWPKRGLDL